MPTPACLAALHEKEKNVKGKINKGEKQEEEA
jgi:hypothetical protein